MASQRITVRISNTLKILLRKRACAKGVTPSAIIRVALEKYFDKKPSTRSGYEAAMEAGLIGCANGAPRDLSTNRDHFERAFRTVPEIR